MAIMKTGEELLKTKSGDKWGKIGLKKRSGVLVPLFSIYSKDTIGIGELDDIKLMADWCVKTGNSIIQLLPLNKLGATFCPYDSISSFALEPLYMSLKHFGGSSKGPLAKEIKALVKAFPPGAKFADYSIKEEKIRLLRKVFNEEDPEGTPEFKRFKQDNSYWLEDFGLFAALKSYYKNSAWFEWEDGHRLRDPEALELFRKSHSREISFRIWMQWHLYRQFKEVKEYVASKGVFLKGDLPILVSRDSADVWAHPEFFKLDLASGAPPDMYTSRGQRWGMPPNNWEEIVKDGYKYIKEKLKYSGNFYDILRVDHVVGLFRIWSIPYNEPAENQGLNGHFDPPEESKWGPQGSKILSVMLESTDMLLCAEDLGTIPKICTDTIRKLGIPGNEVQRWVKDWEKRHDFLMPQEYRGLSVAMLSTHDTTSWAAWWENEAGTVDEPLFVKKCLERGIDYKTVKKELFDGARSRHNRLRWRDDVSTTDIFLWRLGKKKEEVMDFVEMYLNSFHEKESLWALFGISGPMREKADKEIIACALKYTLSSEAIFCIETIFDWLSLDGILKDDPYAYRINTPGTTGPGNWSLVVPASLEDLLESGVCPDIKKLTRSARPL